MVHDHRAACNYVCLSKIEGGVKYLIYLSILHISFHTITETPS